MKFKAVILVVLFCLCFSLPASALSIDLRTLSGDSALTIDETVTEFTLDLVWSSTPISGYAWETRFGIPDAFDLISYSNNYGTIQDWDTYVRALDINLSGFQIDQPYIASLTFSVDPNALGGDYLFSQVGGPNNNGYGDLGFNYVPFDVSSFMLTIDKAAAPVPEPATMMLLGCGLVGLVGFSRKKVSR